MAAPNRPLQFSLRGIFVVTTVVAALLSLTVDFGYWPGLAASGCLVGYLGTTQSPSRRLVSSPVRAWYLVLTVVTGAVAVSLAAQLIIDHHVQILVGGGSAALGSLLRSGRRLRPGRAATRTETSWAG